MRARILTSLLVLGCAVFLLPNCSSSDGGSSNTPAGGSNGVAGSAAGTPGAAGSAGGSIPAGGGGSSAVGGGGSAGTAVGGSGGGAAGSGGASAGASAGGSGGASAGAGGTAAGGGASGGASGSGGAGAFTLTSEKLTAGMKIPTEYTCASMANPPSPPFAWNAGPSGTMSYALAMVDTSVTPNPFTHWVVWDIPAATTTLPAALGSSATLTMPAGAKQRAGSGMGYLGPCPPGNTTHTYVFTLYALDVATLPGVTTSSSTANLLTAIQMHDVGSASLSAPSDGK